MVLDVEMQTYLMDLHFSDVETEALIEGGCEGVMLNCGCPLCLLVVFIVEHNTHIGICECMWVH